MSDSPLRKAPRIGRAVETASPLTPPVSPLRPSPLYETFHPRYLLRRSASGEELPTRSHGTEPTSCFFWREKTIYFTPPPLGV